MKRKVNCCELSVEKIFVALPHIAKAVSETWPNPCIKVNSTLAWSFHREPCCEKDVTLNVNFAICSNNKDKLRDLYNYLNQKVVTAINTKNGFMLGDHSIMSHQVDYMPSQRSFQLRVLKLPRASCSK